MCAVVNATALVGSSSHANTATGQKFVVATVHPMATDAAMDVFREGGNAVDAAVTAALTLGVVDGFNSGIGGGCLILIRSADGSLTAIDGRETAPAAAHKDMYLRDGKPVPSASQTGALAVATPGALAAYRMAIEKCGTKSLARALAPGKQLAEEGFILDEHYARNIRSTASELSRFEGSRDIFFHANGTPLGAGERLVQTDLASTYRNVGEHGTEWFYRGPIANKVGQWIESHEGLLRASDFADYQAKLREPLKTTYRGYEIVGFPPPSSGGIHVAQVLNILEPYDLCAIEKRDRVEATHLIIEAFKLAFADRAHWLGDADFVDVPRGLVAKDYAATLHSKIDSQKATIVESHGTPPHWRQDIFGRHTTHIATADAAGNWVAITATVNTTFGSKVVVPGTGVILNNEMDDFSISPGVPNAFGLIGAESNAVEPFKRPLSSMSPTIVLDRQGSPILTVGAAGGPTIITQVLLAILRTIDFDRSITEAIGQPRFHHQWRPDVVSYEEGIDEKVVDGLRKRGHRLKAIGSAGRSQAIFLDKNHVLVGVSDPRVPGKADGE